jgi:hypothetical protein
MRKRDVYLQKRTHQAMAIVLMATLLAAVIVVPAFANSTSGTRSGYAGGGFGGGGGAAFVSTGSNAKGGLWDGVLGWLIGKVLDWGWDAAGNYAGSQNNCNGPCGGGGGGGFPEQPTGNGTMAPQ